VSYGTWFKSKEPKLKPKLVSTLSETNRLVSDVSGNSEIAIFRDLGKLKRTTLDAKQL
jgi:hypothetical protein